VVAGAALYAFNRVPSFGHPPKWQNSPVCVSQPCVFLSPFCLEITALMRLVDVWTWTGIAFYIHLAGILVSFFVPCFHLFHCQNR